VHYSHTPREFLSFALSIFGAPLVFFGGEGGSTPTSPPGVEDCVR